MTAWPTTSRPRQRSRQRQRHLHRLRQQRYRRGCRLDPALALPDAVRAPMLAGLAKFVEGKLERKHWSPRDDLDVRKLAAIEALSRYGAARPGMLAGITVAPNQWPTSALLDWIGALQRMQGVPDQARLLAEARQILRARLTWQGTRVGLSTEGSDGWWWLMAGTDANLARTLLLALPDPAWKDDLGRLASGFIARQQGGAWHTTVANLWGSLALERFSREREAAPVTGLTEATLGDARAAIDWRQVRRAAPADAQGAPSARRAATAVGGPLTGNTAFLPWPAHAGRRSPSRQARQAVAHRAIAGRRAGDGAVLGRLPDQKDRGAGGPGRRTCPPRTTRAATSCA